MFTILLPILVSLTTAMPPSSSRAPKLTRSPTVIFTDGEPIVLPPRVQPWDLVATNKPIMVRHNAVMDDRTGESLPLDGDFWTKDLVETNTDVVPWSKRRWTRNEVTFGTAVISAYYEYKQVCATFDVLKTNPEWGLTEFQTDQVKSRAAVTSAVWTAGTVFAVSKCWLLPHPIYAIPCSYYIAMKGSEWTRHITNKVACSEYKIQSGKDDCPIVEASLNHRERTALALDNANKMIKAQAAKEKKLALA